MTSAAERGFAAAQAMVTNYVDMREANTKKQDLYFHCKANCQAAQQGLPGEIVAVFVSEGREAVDEHIKGDPPSASIADRAANYIGLQGGVAAAKKGDTTEEACKDVCHPLRPNGLPEEY
jgi:Serum amyloid A protein